jgi:hypothetical protein
MMRKVPTKLCMLIPLAMKSSCNELKVSTFAFEVTSLGSFQFFLCIDEPSEATVPSYGCHTLSV